MGENETNYQGMRVLTTVADQLRGQPIAEFLRFEDQQDGTVTIQAKMPEWGRFNEKNFRIRENLNYFMRGLACGCLDDDGEFDVDKAAKVDDDLVAKLPLGKVSTEFMQLCGVPAERQEDFKTFVSACGVTLDMMRFQFSLEIENLQGFQYNLNHLLAEPDLRETRGSLVRESYEDFKHILANYKQMANADPQEKSVLFALECQHYAGWNVDLMQFANTYHRHRGEPLMTGTRHTINFPDETPEELAQGIRNKFEMHACFVADVRIDNKTKVLSLEATATPAGKLLFCPVGTRTGVGLYDSLEALEEFHLRNNKTVIPDLEKFNRCKNFSSKTLADTKKIAPSETYELAQVIPAVFEQMRQVDAQKSETQKLSEFGSYVEQVQLERDKAAILLQDAKAQARRTGSDTIETARLTTKELLGKYAQLYRETADGDPELIHLLEKVSAYAAMDATAVRGDYAAEAKAYQELTKLAGSNFRRLDALQLGSDTYDPEDPHNRAQYTMAADLFNFFEGQRDGNLAVSKNEKGAIYLDDKKHPVTNVGTSFTDKTSAPLFPHDPTPNDISQGNLGDCYLLAGLSSLAQRDPQKIRDCMRDNGDGTVTVRFYQKNMNEETGEFSGYTPVFVTVDKVVPKSQGTEDCLWAQMIERAYTASGLHCAGDVYAKAVPADIDAQYSRYASSQEELPGHEECPWLIDKNGALHPWQPDYSQIESGHSEHFLEQLLGADGVSVSHRVDTAERKTKTTVNGYKLGVELLAYAIEKKWGDQLSEADKTRVKEMVEKETDDHINAALVDILLHGKRTAELYGESERIATDNPTGYTYFNLFRAIEQTISFPENESPDPLLYRERINNCLATFEKFAQDPQKLPDPVDAGDSMAAMYLNAVCADKKPESLQTVREVADQLRMGVEPLLQAAMPPKLYSGDYNPGLNDAYQYIQDRIKEGCILTSGTSGLSDKKSKDGIYESHAYSVLGVKEKELGGKKLKFVTLRNPHGRMGREYYADKNGGIHRREFPAAPGGVFDMELQDFCREFGAVAHNAPQNPASVVGEAAKENEPKEVRLTGQTMSNYSRVMTWIYQELHESKNGIMDFKNSPQFRELMHRLDVLRKNDGLAQCRGKKLSSVEGILEIRPLYKAYLHHCAEDQRHASRPRRIRREAAVKALDTLMEAMGRGYTDPKQYCLHKMSMALVEKELAEKKIRIPYGEQEKQAKELANSPALQNLKKKMDFIKLAALANKSPEEILTAYSFEKAAVSRASAPVNPSAEPVQNQISGSEISRPAENVRQKK